MTALGPLRCGYEREQLGEEGAGGDKEKPRRGAGTSGWNREIATRAVSTRAGGGPVGGLGPGQESPLFSALMISFFLYPS